MIQRYGHQSTQGKTMSIAHRETCRLCDSKDVTLAVKLNPIPLAEKYTSQSSEAKNVPLYPIDLYMCKTCSHVQLLDVINSDHLWENYTYHSGQTKGILDHFHDVSQAIISKYHPNSGSLIIDIGSNDGSLLRCFKNSGYRVHGVDPAKEIAQKATEAGIETTPSVLNAEVAKRIRKKHGSAAIVTAFNVFAHADDLGAMTDAICSLLNEDGIFVFEVQYLLDIVEKVLIGTIFHEHMSHHSLKPMVQFLNKHGLEIIDVERVTIQKGSIIGFAQRKGGPHKISTSVYDLLELEKKCDLDQLKMLQKFNDRIEKNRHIAQELIKDWKQQNLIIAGYGAARSGPTFMMQYGFNEAIQYIFDDHPQKINRYSPPNGVPVISTAELIKRKPDVVVILAWIHAKSIITNNQEYLKLGGKFVVCIPDVRVIDQYSTF